MIDTFVQDVRYALRGLRRAPGFVVAVFLTLAVGIGATTAVFTIVDAVIVRPLPFSEPDRLVAIYGTAAGEDSNSVSYPNFLDWQRDTRAFESIAIWRSDLFPLTAGGQIEPLFGQMVSASYFDVLGVQPVLGRFFRNDEDQLGGSQVAVLGEDAWRRRFGADPAIIGQVLTLAGRVHTVIGIAPSTVRILRANTSPFNDVFVPIGQYNDPIFRDRGTQNGTFALGRLRPGVSLDQGREDMATLSRGLERTYPASNSGVGVRLESLEEDVAGRLQTLVRALFGAVTFVFLIACANVANLFLARSTAKRHEFALRIALGAGRRRLLAQLLIEGALLSGAGGMAGLAIARWSTGAVLQWLPEALPQVIQLEPGNAVVLAFALAMSLVAATLTPLAPFITAGKVPALGPHGHIDAGFRRGPRSIFVVAQLALTLVLLAGAGLMMRSLSQLWAVDPGFNATNVFTFYTGISEQRAGTPGRIRDTYRVLNDAFDALPGVDAASIAIGALPLTGSTTLGVRRADQPPPLPTDPDRVALFYAVGPDYFRAMQIPVQQGRTFTRLDDASHDRVVAIDRQFAERIFPGENPLGKRMRYAELDFTAEVIAVVGHVKHNGLDLDAESPVQAQFYIPYMQMPDVLAPLTVNIIGTVVRSSVPAGDLLAAVTRAARNVDGGAIVSNGRTMTEIVERSLVRRRFSRVLLSAFAGIALFLSAVGIYGVVSYLVRQRTREMGVRAALGARPADIIRLVLGEGQRLAITGIAVGLFASFLTTRALSGLLYGVSPADPLTLMAVASILLTVTAAACYLPARFASRVDPVTALRSE